MAPVYATAPRVVYTTAPLDRCPSKRSGRRPPLTARSSIFVLTLLTNARVYAPEPLGVRDLLIAADRIAWIGEAGSAPVAPDRGGVAKVDVEGRAVVPGFVDGHAHLTGGGGESGFRSRVPPVALSRFTSAGVTAVVGVLGTDDITRSTRDLVAAAYGLREEGIGAWCHCGGYHVPPVTVTGSVSGDIVFVDPVIGVGEVAISDHRSSQPTLDEVLRLASEAHVAGLVTGKAGILHLHLGDGERGLDLVRQALASSELPPRVFNPTHVNRQPALFDEAVQLANAGAVVDITAYPVADGDPAIPAAEAVRRFLDSNAPAGNVTVSSDGGGCLPEFDADGVLTRMDIGSPSALPATFAELAADGVPLEVLAAVFSANPARLLRLPGRGAVAMGAVADLIVLDDAYRVRDVMAAGVWHVREAEPVRRGLFESP